jgi:hypothetical protein
MTINIDVINSSSVLTDDQVSQALPAFQKQANTDVSTAWGIDAVSLNFVAANAQPSKSHWWIVVLDNSDQAGALGYHDLTSGGLPISKVFAGTDKQYGYNWTVTATHELIEMLVDPWLNLCAVGPDRKIWAYEACDPVEADQLGYQIDGVVVSDFCLPTWWEPPRAGVAVDFKGHITKPLQLAKGGYAQYLDPRRGWVQTTADRAPTEPGEAAYARTVALLEGSDGADTRELAQARAPIGSRRERRRSRDLWVLSTVDAR